MAVLDGDGACSILVWEFHPQGSLRQIMFMIMFTLMNTAGHLRPPIFVLGSYGHALQAVLLLLGTSRG